MSKTFRAWKIDEPLFLPPMVGDFVAKDHLARFVLSLVRDDLGLGEITGTYGASTTPADWRAPSGNITWLDGRWTVSGLLAPSPTLGGNRRLSDLRREGWTYVRH